jgi:protein-S-isoprenylcysteine O-methyltransferase
MYVTGFLLMGWALITLRHNYQSGGSAPRNEDKMVMEGPYRLIRHPMYTAALSISLGLACLIQAWAFVGVFCVYLVLFTLLIPVEGKALRKAYGEQYSSRQQTRNPFLVY